MIQELHALAPGGRVGGFRWDRNRDRLSFVYDPSWQAREDAYPISLSMPLTASTHGHREVEAFLWGLLPDNDGVLRRWGERFQVSARHPFRLLWHVGEECAGALQLLRRDRAIAPATGKVTWLTDDDVAERIADLLNDHSATRTRRDRGQFSLAGAQPKTAFYFDPDQNRWGVPEGATPTTHILKPSTGDYDGLAENEHFCLRVAHLLGLSAASSTVRYFGDSPVIVVERYDRKRFGARVIRVHQEDACQALARRPQTKYQSEGGPSAAEIAGLIRDWSSKSETDLWRLVDSLALNWLIGGTDAHAKNYSFLIAGGGQVRLAPLYDVTSSLPYPRQIDPRRARLAMKIGGKYKLREIAGSQWEKCAAEFRLDRCRVLDRIRAMATKLPDAAASVKSEMETQGLRHGVLDRLLAQIQERSSLGKAI